MVVTNLRRTKRKPVVFATIIALGNAWKGKVICFHMKTDYPNPSQTQKGNTGLKKEKQLAFAIFWLSVFGPVLTSDCPLCCYGRGSSRKHYFKHPWNDIHFWCKLFNYDRKLPGCSR